MKKNNESETYDHFHFRITYLAAIDQPSYRGRDHVNGWISFRIHSYRLSASLLPVCFALANFEGNECTAEQPRIGSCRTTDVQKMRVLRCLFYLRKRRGQTIFNLS